MCDSDWSSDVCSSDLTQRVRDSYPGVEINRKRIEEAVERADGIARRVGMVTGISPG